MDAPKTWHHGLVADWWALFNTGGPEIEYFGRYVGRGQPALDAGCGTGRLLIPWLQEGYDVDGCDVSEDMVARCRASAEQARFAPTLWVQALHDLDPPRRYRTIVVCGVFGLGSTREQDDEALRRLHASLEPGGTLLLDSEVPYVSSMRWQNWPKDEREQIPEDWPERGMTREAKDGSVYELRSRAVRVDPLDQSVVLAMRAEKHGADQTLTIEEHELAMRGYFCHELVMMLERAGFHSVDVRGDHTDEAAGNEHNTLVYIATA
jgi:SAM-dependent methyltransferase